MGGRGSSAGESSRAYARHRRGGGARPRRHERNLMSRLPASGIYDRHYTSQFFS